MIACPNQEIVYNIDSVSRSMAMSGIINMDRKSDLDFDFLKCDDFHTG